MYDNPFPGVRGVMGFPRDPSLNMVGIRAQSPRSEYSWIVLNGIDITELR